MAGGRKDGTARDTLRAGKDAGARKRRDKAKDKAKGKGKGKAKKAAKAASPPAAGRAPAPVVVELHVRFGGLEGTVLAGPATAALAAPPAGDGAGGAEGRWDVPAWPMEPHYLRWVEGKGADAWARLKLKASGWYLEVLEAAERDGGLDRYVGVEMAIDGVLASLCAGIDAAGYALLDEIERFAGPTPGRRAAVGEDWPEALGIAESLGVDLPSAVALGRALRPAGMAEPEGWLSQLRRLHRLVIRRNVLVRRPSVDGTERGRLLDVPSAGPRPVVRHLTQARRRAETLVEQLLADVEHLQHRHHVPANSAAGGARALRDLSERADVLGARYRGPEGA